MKTVAVILFSIAFVTQGYGLYGVVATARRARAALPLGGVVKPDTDGTPYFDESADDGSTALEALATPRLAIAALAVGVLTGFLGNLAALQ